MPSSWDEALRDLADAKSDPSGGPWWVSPRARDAFLGNLDTIKEHVPEPTYAFFDDGVASVEQHVGDRVTWCYATEAGEVRISRWIGSQRDGEPIVLNGKEDSDGEA